MKSLAMLLCFLVQLLTCFAFSTRMLSLSVTRMMAEGANEFERITKALDSDKQQLGRNYGALFEMEVQETLKICGYQNFFWDDDKDSKIWPILIKVGPKDSNGLSEFDAFAIGTHKNFVNFEEQFLVSSSEFPPLVLEGTSGRHLLVVEAKLNSKLLFEWITKSKKTGSSKLFFGDDIDSSFVKVVVINGGSESEKFVKSMNLQVPPVEFVEYINLLKENKINVFYKLWASGETFQDILKENKDIKAENKDIKAENKDIKAEIKDIKELLEKLMSSKDIKEVK